MHWLFGRFFPRSFTSIALWKVLKLKKVPIPILLEIAHGQKMIKLPLLCYMLHLFACIHLLTTFINTKLVQYVVHMSYQIFESSIFIELKISIIGANSFLLFYFVSPKVDAI